MIWQSRCCHLSSGSTALHNTGVAEPHQSLIKPAGTSPAAQVSPSLLPDQVDLALSTSSHKTEQSQGYYMFRNLTNFTDVLYTYRPTCTEKLEEWRLLEERVREKYHWAIIWLSMFITYVCYCGSVVEHCVSSAKGCGFNSQGTHILIKKKKV